MKVISINVSKSDGTSWATIDPNSLSEDLQAAYEMYQTLRADARKAQAEFEAMFRAEAGTAGIRFGYNFGKLAIAQGEPPKAKAQPKPTMSLGDFLANANGRRV